MNRLLLFLLFIPAFSFCQLLEDNRIETQFIVMLKPGIAIEKFEPQFQQITVKQCLSHQMNIWLLERSTKAGADDFLLALRKNDLVKLAQFNHQIERRSITPNDTLFSLEWNLMNTGQGGGTPGDDIDATDAWSINHNNVTAAGDTLVVAIVDGTFDETHTDLNFFVNRSEVPGNSIDDDGNGYVDDYLGWNAYNNTGNINAGGGDPHSMHLCGIAGAVSNNTTGIAGVCWGPKILRVSGSTGVESIAVNAYDYVLTMRRQYNNSFGSKGAFIVSTNSSFGVNNGNPVDYPIWCAMYDSLGKEGILNAAATANAPIDVDVVHDMPTECPSNWLIAVTNTDDKDRLYGAAAYGRISIDLGAPGTNIYSTITNNGYGYNTGCSMSSPHVAGAITAMYAAACPKLISDYFTHPDSVALFMKQMLLTGTTHLSTLYNRTTSGGRLNLYNAFMNLKQYNCSDCNFIPQLSYTQPSCSNTCDGNASVTVPPGTYTFSWNNSSTNASIQNLCPGIYSVTVSDTSGCQQIRNFTLNKPDSIVVTDIHTIAATDSSPGNIVITAAAGHYDLTYSLDGINYQSTPIFVVNHNGNFPVYIKSETGCSALVNAALAIDKVVPDFSFSIYPNPANYLLHLSFSTARQLMAKFTVTNIVGENLIEEQKQIPSGLHNATIDIADLPSGVYFLQISNGQNSQVGKFMVAK